MVSSVAGGADPGRGAERLTERLFSWQTRTLGSGSRGAAETRRKSNLPPSALSAHPREKKSVGAVVVAGTGKVGQWPEGKVSSSSVAGGADPGSGAERLLSRQTLGNGSRGDAETRRKSNLSSSALSAPPREKKSVGAVVVAGTGKAVCGDN